MVNRSSIALDHIAETSKAAFFTISFNSANLPASHLYLQQFLNASPLSGSLCAQSTEHAVFGQEEDVPAQTQHALCLSWLFSFS